MVSAQEPGTEGPWGRRGCGIELRLERTPGEDWGGCHGGCLSGSEGGVRWEVVLKVQGEAVTGGAPGLRVGGGAGGRGGGGRRQAEGAGACGAGWGRIALGVFLSIRAGESRGTSVRCGRTGAQGLSPGTRLPWGHVGHGLPLWVCTEPTRLLGETRARR